MRKSRIPAAGPKNPSLGVTPFLSQARAVTITHFRLIKGPSCPFLLLSLYQLSSYAFNYCVGGDVLLMSVQIIVGKCPA